MYTYCHSIPQTSHFHDFRSQFLQRSNYAGLRKDLSHNKLHSDNYKLSDLRPYLTSFYYLFIKLKNVFASLNSKNNGTVQLFNTIFRH